MLLLRPVWRSAGWNAIVAEQKKTSPSCRGGRHIFAIDLQQDLEADAIIHTFVYVCISVELHSNLSKLSK